MKAAISLIITAFLFSFSAPKDDWEIWDEWFETYQGSTLIKRIVKWSNSERNEGPWLMSEYSFSLNEHLVKCTVGERKLFYRSFVANALNQSNRLSPLSSSSRAYIGFLKNDFSHAFKYLEKVNTAQLQFLMRRYIIACNNEFGIDYDERSQYKLPAQFSKFKSLKRRVYLIARAEYNKLVDGHEVEYRWNKRFRKKRRRAR